jgi:Domain of unknown function (DUF1990)
MQPPPRKGTSSSERSALRSSGTRKTVLYGALAYSSCCVTVCSAEGAHVVDDLGNTPESCHRYEIFTISKPATPLARLTYPLVRFHQRHFARQSLRKMVLGVSEGSDGPVS